MINRSCREFHELGAPSVMKSILLQYLKKEFAGGGAHRKRKPLVDRVIKMHKFLGLKSEVFIDDMREWSKW
jgi:hypothetical protein